MIVCRSWIVFKWKILCRIEGVSAQLILIQWIDLIWSYFEKFVVEDLVIMCVSIEATKKVQNFVAT